MIPPHPREVNARLARSCAGRGPVVNLSTRSVADRQTTFSHASVPLRGGGLIYVLRYLWVVLCTTFWGTVALPTMLLDRSGEGVIWIGRRWIRWILRGCRIEVETRGAGNVDPAHPQIFMPNHQSALDVAAVLVALPVSFRFVAKKEITRIPFIGWAAIGGGHIIVDRGDNAQAVARLKQAVSRIRTGTNVVIFPEGTRSVSGRLRPFKSGGFHLAIQSGVPIVPVTVSGSWRLTPKRSLKLRSGRLVVTIGKPIATAGLGVDDRERLKARVRDALLAGFDPALQEPLEARPVLAAQTPDH
jgi:1-acyl-sn-glycerol-3-phosphate acyltransferase